MKEKMSTVDSAIDAYLNHYGRINYGDIEKFFGYSGSDHKTPIRNIWRVHFDNPYFPTRKIREEIVALDRRIIGLFRKFGSKYVIEKLREEVCCGSEFWND